MTHLLANLVLAQRSNDIEGWVNILFIVVMVVFWVIGGIVKSKVQKTESKAQQSKPAKPNRKTRDEDNSFWEQFLGPLREAIDTEKQKQAQKIKKAPVHSQIKAHSRPVPAKVRFESQAAESKDVSVKESPVAETLFPIRFKPDDSPYKIESPPSISETSPSEPVTEHAQLIMQQRKSDSLEKPSESPGFDISLFDQSEPDELKKAIIYYEILGKPLSERIPLD